MVGVVGIIFPDAEHPMYAIAEIAVKPMVRGEGIGSEILNKLYLKHPLKDNETWIAFVDKDNFKASAFLESNGWRRVGAKPDEHGMLEYRNKPA